MSGDVVRKRCKLGRKHESEMELLMNERPHRSCSQDRALQVFLVLKADYMPVIIDSQTSNNLP